MACVRGGVAGSLVSMRVSRKRIVVAAARAIRSPAAAAWPEIPPATGNGSPASASRSTERLRRPTASVPGASCT